jgi:hypothetical protein
MLFGHHQLDKTIDEHLGEVAGLANAPGTLVFLDTNILAYLYKLHTAARHEFFDWLNAVVGANRLAIPAWAASEYLSRVTSKGLGEFTPKSKEPSQILKSLEAMHETASLFVDESLLKKIGVHGDRNAYLGDFRNAIDALKKCTRAFSEQFDPSHIHEEIVKNLSSAIIDSDLTELANRASKDGHARFENRLPPGFLDGEKAKNRFGDLIIWYEILAKSTACATTFADVLFITNDEKADWVYAPKERTLAAGEARKSVPNTNPEIKIADPRLISEFRRQAGHSSLTICSLATLIEGLSKVNAAQFTQLAAAIQINTDESSADPALKIESDITVSESSAENSSSGTAQSLVETPSVSEPVVDFTPAAVATTPDHPRLTYDFEALQDSQYQVEAPTEINEVIRALKSHNWYTQNPAIGKLRTFRDVPFTPSSWFVLGRNIYQAACGNSQKAMDFIVGLESQLAQFSQENAFHLLAGVLFEVYFDGAGAFRENLKFAYADKPLAIVTAPEYALVREFIQSHLQEHSTRLKFMPGDKVSAVIEITSTGPVSQDDSAHKGTVYVLESITFNQIELIRDLGNNSDVWGQLFAGSMQTLQNLKDKISEDLAVPKWALLTKFNPTIPADVRFTIPAGRSFYPRWALETTADA